MGKRRYIKSAREICKEDNLVEEEEINTHEALRYAREAAETPFDEAELIQIEMYQQTLKNSKFVADTKCWNCGKMYYGDNCPYCGAFKPKDVTK